MDSISRFNSPMLNAYAHRIRFVRRTQALRWFHSQVEDPNSALRNEQDIPELLRRVRESFNGPAEP